MTDIRVDYQALSDISGQLRSLSTHLETVYRSAGDKSHELYQNGWMGEGADAFFQEWGEFFPRLKRLFSAILEASISINKIAETFQEAEETASNQVKDSSGASASAGVGGALPGSDTGKGNGARGEASAGGSPGHSESVGPRERPNQGDPGRVGGQPEQGESNGGRGPGNQPDLGTKEPFPGDTKGQGYPINPDNGHGQPGTRPDVGTKGDTFPGGDTKGQGYPINPDNGHGQPGVQPEFGTKERNPGDVKVEGLPITPNARDVEVSPESVSGPGRPN